MSITKYRAFLSVVQLGSLTKAAKALDYTQPGISHMILSLEKEFGFPLLVRTSHGVKPTEYAETLLPYIEQLVSVDNMIHANVKSIQKSNVKSLRIGCTFTVSNFWIPPILKNLEARYENMKISLFVVQAEELEQYLADDIIDIAFMTSEVPSYYISVPLVSEPLMVMVPFNHPIAQKKEVSPFELEKYPFIAFADEIIESEVFSPLGLKPDIKYRVRSDAVTERLVSTGMGISFIYKPPTQNVPKTVIVVPLSGNYSRTISIAYKKTADSSDIIKEFISITKDYLLTHYEKELLQF